MVSASDFMVLRQRQREWATDDLMRTGSKLQEFAADAGIQDFYKRRLVEEVTRAIHEYEEESGLSIL